MYLGDKIDIMMDKIDVKEKPAVSDAKKIIYKEARDAKLKALEIIVNGDFEVDEKKMAKDFLFQMIKQADKEMEENAY